ncbi:hypothetical protein JW992_13695 [candidate division KSB1 bacterium]|nr:hypothetical protein [candidate division KSB1 bacterium]
MSTKVSADVGIHTLLPRERMCASAQKLRDTYNRTPNAPLFHKTFGLWLAIDHWYETGLDRSIDLDEFFFFDPPGHHEMFELGWCEAAFSPLYKEEILEQFDDKEIVRDFAGRRVLYFKGRRHGFMPEYLDHPVHDRRTWEEDVKWRLDPHTPERYSNLDERMRLAMAEAATGKMIQQRLIGGYMYLRSLIGPESLLYFFYDQAELLHDCMRTWLALADHVIAVHQKYVTLDELYIAEDICYNSGPLIAPEMIKEFLFPYYQELVARIRARQLDCRRHLYVQIDTDGYAVPVIDLYREAIGMDVMSPFEVASGCDVVKIGGDCPWLVLSGGIDKRILARGPEAIDAHVQEILPILRRRGGYIPTCDHGVPPEVTWQNYRHYRQRCVEMGG